MARIIAMGMRPVWARTLALVAVVALLAYGLAAAAMSAAGVAHAQRPARPATAAASSFTSHFFAPYIDTSAGMSITNIEQQAGTKFLTLAFMLSGGGCSASWNGNTPVGQGFMQSDISSFRAAGGDVSVSFGGAAGTELGQACTSVSSLQAAYQSAIDAYNFTHIDFDIEGAAVADSASIDRRNKAIAGLEQAASSAGRQLTVSYTLPVLPTGLVQSGIDLLNNAVANGTRVDIVNIMTMDYGSSFPPNQMGQNAINAANALHTQLGQIFTGRSSAQLWAMEGNTPMIGDNDTQPEVFTQSDANMLLSFAQQQGMSELAFWSVNRDQACPGGATGGPASGSCSGVSQNQFDFERIFNQFNGGGGGGPTPTPTPTPTTRPTPTPTPPPGGNGVVNGGFESGRVGWSCSTVDSVVSSPVHSGSHALSAAANNSDNGQCTQTISVQANHSYTLSAWVQGAYAFIGVSGGGTGDPSTFTPSSSGFTQLSVPFTTGSGVSSLTVFVHGWYGQGTVFVDDVAVN